MSLEKKARFKEEDAADKALCERSTFEWIKNKSHEVEARFIFYGITGSFLGFAAKAIDYLGRLEISATDNFYLATFAATSLEIYAHFTKDKRSKVSIPTLLVTSPLTYEGTELALDLLQKLG